MKHPRRKPFFAALLRGCLFFFLLTWVSLAQRDDFTIALYGSLNEDAKIFLHPNAADPVMRQRSEALGSAYSAALSGRYRVFPTVSLDLRGEYVSLDDMTIDAVGTAMENGVRVVLLEASALFALPFSGQRFEMYAGGGLGLYGGRRVHSVAGVEAEHVSSLPALGMQVILGAEYLIFSHAGIRFELLFRDPQMGVENRFSQPSVTSSGVNYPLETEPFRSNLNLGGNVYSLGLFYSF